MNIQKIKQLESACIRLAEMLATKHGKSIATKIQLHSIYNQRMIDLSNATHELYLSTNTLNSPFSIDQIIIRYESETGKKTIGLYKFLLFLQRNNHLK